MESDLNPLLTSGPGLPTEEETPQLRSVHTSPLPGPMPFLIRQAGASDLAHVRAWLPEAVGGTPAARLMIATDVATKAVVGVAALRVFDDQVGRFLLYVDPACRRRGCGTAR